MSIPLSRPVAAVALFACIAGVLFAVAWKPAGPAPDPVASPSAPAEIATGAAARPTPDKTTSESDLSAFYAGASDDGAGNANSGDDVAAPENNAAPDIQPPNVTIVQQPAQNSQPAVNPIGPAPVPPIE